MIEQNNAEDNRMGLLSFTADIVCAHVSNNKVNIEDMPVLIRHVFDTIYALKREEGSCIEEKLEPAVPIHKSVKPGYIVCLEDGKKLKMLKRHLKTAYNMTPEEYKLRWGLGSDYPMVAPEYAKQRSQLARDIGLGKKAKR